MNLITISNIIKIAIMNEQKYQLFRLFFTVSVPIIITATYLLLRKSNNLEPIDKKLIKKKSKIQIIQDTDSSGGMLVDVPIKENPEVLNMCIYFYI